VADQYAFIPREAVSRFLLHCTQCQKKPVAGLVNNFDIKKDINKVPTDFNNDDYKSAGGDIGEILVLTVGPVPEDMTEELETVVVEDTV